MYSLNFIRVAINKIFWIPFGLLLIAHIALQYENIYIKQEIQDFLLAASLILGILGILFQQDGQIENPPKWATHDYAFMLGFIVIFEMLIYYKLVEKEIGNNTWLTMLIMGLLLIALIGLFWLSSEERTSPEDVDFPINRKIALATLAVFLFFVIGYISDNIILRSLMAGIYILFLGGYFWTYVFFDYLDLNPLERIVLGVLFSLIIVPMSLFYINRIGIPITVFSILSVNTILILLGFQLYKKKPAIREFLQEKKLLDKIFR